MDERKQGNGVKIFTGALVAVLVAVKIGRAHV